jgi:hypothetical protein
MFVTRYECCSHNQFGTVACTTGFPCPEYFDFLLTRGFQVVALVTSLTQLRDVQEQITSLGADYDDENIVSLAETTYIVHNHPRKLPDESLSPSAPSCLKRVRVVDAEVYRIGRRDGAISTGFPRPSPLFYDPNRIRADLGQDTVFVILRWDRMVFAKLQRLDRAKRGSRQDQDRGPWKVDTITLL